MNKKRQSGVKSGGGRSLESRSSGSRPKKSWRQQEALDPYFQEAKKRGYRSRASLKLLEINQKESLLKKGDWVLDLGAAPGGWSQVAVDCVGKDHVVAIDLLPIQPLEGVSFLQLDLRDPKTLATIREGLPSSGVRLVISDMAPNISGIRSKDQADSLKLGELAFDVASSVLIQKGCFLVKLFQGPDIKGFADSLKTQFKQVRWIKPKSSRADSSEVYLLASGFLLP